MEGQCCLSTHDFLSSARTMSHTHPIVFSSSSSSSSTTTNFRLVLNAALEAYETKTKCKLLTHPLVAQLQSCDSPTAILAVLQDLIQQFDHRRRSDERLASWLIPTVNVLYAFSSTLGQGVGLVSLNQVFFFNLLFDHHSSDILACKRGLLRYRCPSFGEHHLRYLSVGYHHTDISQTAKDVDSSQDILVDIFVRIESFFKRLESYTEVRPTATMTDVIVKILIEILSILGIATKQIKQGRSSESTNIHN